MQRKILIVEDNERNRVLLRDLLRHHGYAILESGDGGTAVRLAREHLPDLILMDIQLPVMDGISALKALKEDAATQGIKIIALTAFTMKGDRERMLEEGFDEFLPKPVDIRGLPVLIRSLLGEEGSS